MFARWLAPGLSAGLIPVPPAAACLPSILLVERWCPVNCRSISCWIRTPMPVKFSFATESASIAT